jgi:decaprenyl-phosphate phosphoribosyltransferase
MALAKRRDDVLIYLETGEKMRKVVDGYNLQSLDAAMAIMAPESFSATTITQHLQE